MDYKYRICMIFLLLFLVLGMSSAVLTIKPVELKSLVNDYANIIDDSSEAELNSILKQIYDSGVAEYTVVTIKSLEGEAIEEYSLDMVQGKLGDSTKNNGLALLVALDDHKYRFEVGRGIEYILNDAKVGRIGRTYLVPNFRADDYSLGIVQASLAVKSILLNDTTSDFYVDSSMSDDEIIDLVIVLAILFFFIVFPIILFFMTRYKEKNKPKSKYFDAAMTAVWIFSRFGGKGSGGSSGGFGGFSGGGFGGGGASGGW